VILIHQRHRRTDGQTEGRHAISIPRYALVHRAVKMKWRIAEMFASGIGIYTAVKRVKNARHIACQWHTLPAHFACTSGEVLKTNLHRKLDIRRAQ